MKIESVNVTVFRYPARRVSDSAGHSHPGAESMAEMAVLTITADDGAQGLSLAPPEVVRPFVVSTFFCKVLVRRDPFNRKRIWQDLNRWQHGNVHQLTERALSSVEQALWDLIDHSLRIPVYKLLGDYRGTVPAHGSTICGDDLPGSLPTPEEYAAFAEKLVAHGYKTIKLRIWVLPVSFAPNPKVGVKVCAAVREAVGPDIDLTIDGYHWYSRTEALWIDKALEKLNFAWFEEPTEEDLMSSYTWLAENLSIPIVGPESFGDKHHMHIEWMKAGACDILRTGTNGVGGVTPTMRVATPAESFGMDCEVHGSSAAGLAMVSAVHNCHWYERGLLHPFLDYDEPTAYLNSIIDPMDDQRFVYLSQRPGLGKDISFAYIEANTVSHDRFKGVNARWHYAYRVYDLVSRIGRKCRHPAICTLQYRQTEI